MARRGRLILIIDPDLDFVEDTRLLLAGERVLTARSLDEAEEIAMGGRLDAAVLGPSFGNEAGVRAAGGLLAVDPGLHLVLAANVVTNRVLLAALQTGLADVVDTPLTVRKLGSSLASRSRAGTQAPLVDVRVEVAPAAAVTTEAGPAPVTDTPTLSPTPSAVPAPLALATVVRGEADPDAAPATPIPEAVPTVPAVGAATLQPAPAGTPVPPPPAVVAVSEGVPTAPVVVAPVPEPVAPVSAPLPPVLPEPAADPAGPAVALGREPLGVAPTSTAPEPALPTAALVPPAAIEEMPPPLSRVAVPSLLVAEPLPPPFPPPPQGAPPHSWAPSEELPAVAPTAVAPPAAAPSERDEPPLRPTGEGRVIVVMAGKGGSGKSVTATNLALALTFAVGEDTVAIVDADLQFGDVALLLQMDPVRSVAEVARQVEDLSEARLDALVLRHESGLRVLPAPLQPAIVDSVAPKAVLQVVEKMRGLYRYVVVDTGAVLDDVLMTLLDHADDVIVVVDMDLPSVKNAKVVLDILRAGGYPMERLHLVVNRINAKARLDLVELERSLGLRTAAAIPSDRLVPQSVNEGVPVVALSPRSRVSRAFTNLAKIFLPGAGRKGH